MNRCALDITIAPLNFPAIVPHFLNAAAPASPSQKFPRYVRISEALAKYILTSSRPKNVGVTVGFRAKRTFSTAVAEKPQSRKRLIDQKSRCRCDFAWPINHFLGEALKLYLVDI